MIDNTSEDFLITSFQAGIQSSKNMELVCTVEKAQAKIMPGNRACSVWTRQMITAPLAQRNFSWEQWGILQ